MADLIEINQLQMSLRDTYHKLETDREVSIRLSTLLLIVDEIVSLKKEMESIPRLSPKTIDKIKTDIQSDIQKTNLTKESQTILF